MAIWFLNRELLAIWFLAFQGRYRNFCSLRMIEIFCLHGWEAGLYFFRRRFQAGPAIALSFSLAFTLLATTRDGMSNNPSNCIAESLSRPNPSKPAAGFGFITLLWLTVGLRVIGFVLDTPYPGCNVARDVDGVAGGVPMRFAIGTESSRSRDNPLNLFG